MAPLVSVVIVNWNTRELLRNCLASLPWSTAELDVIVVDNASTDGSPAMLRREFPQVRLIRNRANVGFVRANNQGLEAARGELMFMLNSDTEVQPGAVERLAEVVTSDPRIGATGPRLLNTDGTHQVSAAPWPRLRHRWLPSRFEHRYDLELEQRVLSTTEHLARVDWLGGAAVMTRRDVVERVGGLDEHYYMWWDDIDWSRRLDKAGLARVFVADAVVVHHGRQSGRQLANRRLAEQLFDSEYTYLRLHEGLAATWAVWGLRVGKAFVRLAATRSATVRDEARWRLRYHLSVWRRFCLVPLHRW